MTGFSSFILTGLAISMAGSTGEGREFDISLEKIMASIETLSGDGMKGRTPLSTEHEMAREWLVQQMKEREFTPAGSAPDSYLQPFSGGVNLLALINPGQGGRGPTVLLSAHYDHLGSNCNRHPGASSEICNGAADNAASVAALLEVADVISDHVETPVALAFWDCEEHGFLGSKYFAAEPGFDTGSLKLMINLDILGLNFYKGLENGHFVIGGETGGAALVQQIQRISDRGNLRIFPFSFALGYFRNDLTTFLNAGYRIPMVLFTDGDGSVYHTTADETAHINGEKVVAVAKLVARLTVEASSGKIAYTHHPPRVHNGQPLPDFQDAVTLLKIVEQVVAVSSQNGLDAGQVERLKTYATQLEDVIGAGPSGFGMEGMSLVAAVGSTLSKFSRNLDFIP